MDSPARGIEALRKASAPLPLGQRAWRCGQIQIGNDSPQQRVVYEEFQRWFANSAGQYERYEGIASELWEVWQKHLEAT